MKHFRQLCAGMVLTLSLALPAFAGHIPCGNDDPPPPPPTTQSVTMDGIAVSLLQSVLALF